MHLDLISEEGREKSELRVHRWYEIITDRSICDHLVLLLCHLCAITCTRHLLFLLLYFFKIVQYTACSLRHAPETSSLPNDAYVQLKSQNIGKSFGISFFFFILHSFHLVLGTLNLKLETSVAQPDVSPAL